MLKKTLSECEFTALDLETTGLDPNQSEILEIAAIRFDRNGILKTFNYILKPTKPLFSDNEALKVNGITLEMLENGHDIDEILPIFEDFIAGSCLVIQNAEFDLGFLHFQFKQRQKHFPTLPVFCTLNLARKVFPNFKKYGLVKLRKEFKIGKYDTSTIRQNFHEALDDSYACMKVFIEIVNQLNWKSEIGNSIFHTKNFKTSDDYLLQNWLF